MAGPVSISFRLALLVCFVICFVSCNANEISVEEFLEMKNYLRFINRPGEKTIETEEGDIFDCVDINKQPAFDHPALRNQTVHMEPASIPDWVNAEPSEYITMKTGRADRGCPMGTVPIKRVQMEDLLKAGSVSNLMNKYGRSGYSPDRLKVTQHKYAVESMSGLAGGVYKGTQVTINLWKPQVKSTEIFSLAQLWVTNGPSNTINTIEAGWNVYPGLYGGDSSTHLFIYWTADGYHGTGCYNLQCPGFVQVSSTITPGMSLRTISTYGGNQVDMTLLAFWDEGTTSWWLGYYGTNGGNVNWVGYWPGKLFKTLVKTANRIDWGGEVVGDSTRTFPQMGSGHFPSEGYRKAAYMKKIMYVDPNLVLRDIPTNVRKSETCPSGYKLQDMGTGSSDFRRYFFYGGPGGRCTTTSEEAGTTTCMEEESE
ncbi:protein neprosin-like [Aristolochia californica]|uniref:protein neprosin-like n=1 Tax=Aristolochia californica TaxID=171875 RepID=UPI0035DBC69A